MTFAKHLDPDQAQQNVGPDLDSKLFDIRMVLLKISLSKKVIF